MKRFLVFVSFCLLGAGVSRADTLPASPEAILMRAVEQSVRCDFHAEEAVFDDNNEILRWEPISRKSRARVEKLTLKTLFREGRYQISSHPVRIEKLGRQMIAMSFWPQEPDKQLGPEKGQSEEAVRVMNNLSGRILIDEAAYGIVGFDADLEGEYDFVWGIFPWKLDHMSVEMKQEFRDGVWVPKSFDMTAAGTWNGLIVRGDFLQQYQAVFNCGE